MNIIILDDYQDAVRKLACAARLESYTARVYTNTVKGLGQLSVRLKDADVIVLNRERPQYITNLKHGAWQQSGLKSANMPTNFGLGTLLKGKTLGIWGYGKVGQLVAGYGEAFGMRVLFWGREASRERAVLEGFEAAASREELFEQSDVLSLHLRLSDETRGLVRLNDLSRMKTTSMLVNTSRAELIEPDALVAGLNRGGGLGHGLGSFGTKA